MQERVNTDIPAPAGAATSRRQSFREFQSTHGEHRAHLNCTGVTSLPPQASPGLQTRLDPMTTHLLLCCSWWGPARQHLQHKQSARPQHQQQQVVC